MTQQFTIGGITFGQPKAHWWDNLPVFDDFTGNNGDPPDTNKWDVSLENESSNFVSVEIQGNDCQVSAERDSGSAPAAANLILKTALTGGKIMAITTSFSITDFADSFIQVGNATDGWTTIAASDTNDDDINFTTSVEAIHKGGNDWDVYTGNFLVQNNLTLPNGLKLRWRSASTIDNDDAVVLVKEVYIQN